MTLDLDERLGSRWTPEHEAERNDMLNALLSKPCLMRYNPETRCYVRTDFSALGFGGALPQPDDDEESLAAVRREMAGGECEFMKKDSKCHLRPVAFVAQCCRSKGK